MGCAAGLRLVDQVPNMGCRVARQPLGVQVTSCIARSVAHGHCRTQLGVQHSQQVYLMLLQKGFGRQIQLVIHKGE